MNILPHEPLDQHSTMRLGGVAAYCTDVASRQDLTDAVTWANKSNLPIIMVGSGSNIVWRDEGFPGLILVNKIKKHELFNEDDQNIYLTLGAGEDLDEVIGRVADLSLTGIECLSLIPGTVGATPIQNVGAYGQEISQTLVSVEVYDLTTKAFANIPGTDCGFGYRTSRFKTSDKGRFLITAITLHLMKGSLQPPFYPALAAYLDANKITEFTPKVIRQAIISIRTAKLPNPKEVANNGSFFANPIISASQAKTLLDVYPDMPHWAIEDSAMVKLSAAWLVEQVGFKNVHDKETGIATWPAQSLVFINESAKTTADLLKFSQKVQDAVEAKFNVALTMEPELLP